MALKSQLPLGVKDGPSTYCLQEALFRGESVTFTLETGEQFSGCIVGMNRPPGEKPDAFLPVTFKPCGLWNLTVYDYQDVFEIRRYDAKKRTGILVKVE